MTGRAPLFGLPVHKTDCRVTPLWPNWVWKTLVEVMQSDFSLQHSGCTFDHLSSFLPSRTASSPLLYPWTHPGLAAGKSCSSKGRESQPPVGSLFHTFDKMLRLYILLAHPGHQVENPPVRMSCVVPLRDQKEKSISESTPVTLGGCNRGLVGRNT